MSLCCGIDDLQVLWAGTEEQSCRYTSEINTLVGRGPGLWDGTASMKKMTSGGGWAAIKYSLRMANRVGWWRLWKAMRSRNACKTCALGMGGQAGGMRNEMRHWPEVCKKSFQAMVGDMQQGLRPEFFAQYSIAQLQTLSPRELEWCGRLTEPLFAAAGATHYRPVAWDEALQRIADELKQSRPDQTFFYASGRSSNEAGFLLQLLARLYGTNFVNNCSYYCHQASGVGLSSTIGTGTATVTLDDVEKADLFLLIGGNPASNHPRLMRTLMTVRRNKGQVVVINPVKEIGLVNFRVPSDVRSMLFGTRIASLYVQPHIGGDMALLNGVAKLILERGALDRRFIAAATEGFDAFAAQVRATSWADIEEKSGVDRATIERVADYYAAAKNVVIGWTMGITHHEHGVANVKSIVNLALLRGMVGRPRAGLLPIRGHSNVQGMGSVGVVPTLKQQVLDNLETTLGVRLPQAPGLDTMACMQAADRGELRSAFCLGGNLFGSNPDAAFAHQALGKLELVTYLNTTLNTGHAWGSGRSTLILPVLARDEEPEPTTQESMFSFVRLSDGQEVRLQGPRSEVEIIAALGQKVLGDSSPVNWQAMRRHCHVRELIARVIPGYADVGTIDQTRKEFHIPGRVMHEPRFPTPNGKAQFSTDPLPPMRGDHNQLRLMTVRSEGQFNTVVYEEEDIYRGQERRDVILMNRHDIDRLGLHVDQKVTVESSVGRMPEILVREFDIRAGNALMYFPEANVLVPTTADPLSRTPAFKCVVVTVKAEVPAPARNGASAASLSSGKLPLDLV
jgi:molybdopterin-dependent oxidoreductase alpha subunit